MIMIDCCKFLVGIVGMVFVSVFLFNVFFEIYDVLKIVIVVEMGDFDFF